MGWVVTVRMCYDNDSKRRTGKPAGTVTRETTKRFALRGLRLIGTALYQGYFDTESDALLAVRRIAHRQFRLGVPPVALDHSIVTIYKAGTVPQPNARQPKRKPSDRTVAKRALADAESEVTVAEEEMKAAQDAFEAAKVAREKAEQRVQELERPANPANDVKAAHEEEAPTRGGEEPSWEDRCTSQAEAWEEDT